MSTKTLYMLEIEMGRYVRLVCFYAENEQNAWEKVIEWANKEHIELPEDVELLPLPRGFQLNKQFLPGTIQ